MVLALVLLPALADVLKGEAGNPADVWAALFTTFAKVGAFVAVMLIIGRRVIPWLLERVAATGSRELFTLCVLAIALGVAFGSAQMFESRSRWPSSPACCSAVEFSRQAASETLPLRGCVRAVLVSVGVI
jgi:CPA2 family monovalent cation:H+ antiporter-2